MPYNVAVKELGYAWLLTLYGFASMAAAERAIKWQREGEFFQVMFVVSPVISKGRGTNRWRIHSAHGVGRWNNPRNPFYVGYVFRPIRGGWTKEAWKRFIQTIWQPKQRLSHE